MIEFTCEVCGKKFYKRQNNGQRFCSNKCRASVIMPFKKENFKPYNYDETKIRFCLVCGKKLGNGNRTGYCKEHFIEYSDFKKKLSKSAKLRNIGGYKFGSGGGKKCKYDNINFDSSWELAFYIYHKDNNLYIERCKEKRKYIKDNKEYNYIPDFKTDKDIIEIKGYDTEISKLKSLYNPDIIVLHFNEMKQYLDYMKNNYGLKWFNLFINK